MGKWRVKWTGGFRSTAALTLGCRAEEGALDVPVRLRSTFHLWYQALSSD